MTLTAYISIHLLTRAGGLCGLLRPGVGPQLTVCMQELHIEGTQALLAIVPRVGALGPGHSQVALPQLVRQLLEPRPGCPAGLLDQMGRPDAEVWRSLEVRLSRLFSLLSHNAKNTYCQSLP